MRIVPIKPNVTLLVIHNTEILFSYQTPVAACINGVFYKTSMAHSVTTSKHINQWLGKVDFTLKPQSFFNDLGKDN